MQYHYAKVGFGIEEYRTDRAGACPDGLIKMVSPPPPHCDWIANSDGTYLYVEPTDSELSQIEYNWAKSELVLADVEVYKHEDGYDSAVATEAEWRTYRKELRAYATVVDGVYSTAGDRPIAPTN